MGSAVGEVLPLALGIAISPIPIIAAILMLLSPRARSTSLGFLLGWVLGIVLAVTAFALLSALIPTEDGDAANPVAGVLKIGLGILLLLLAVRQWRGRPVDDADPALPKWMSAIGSMTTARGFGLGFLLAALNPKNLIMGAGAGLVIGQAGLSFGQATVVITVFTLLAACTVIVPVLAFLAASARWQGPLDSLRVWLLHNNATVMSILLLVIGVVLIGKGIGSF